MSLRTFPVISLLSFFPNRFNPGREEEEGRRTVKEHCRSWAEPVPSHLCYHFRKQTDDSIRKDMKVDTKDIMSYSKKILSFLIRTYGSACEHPFVLGMLFFMLMLYIFLPCVFGFLVSSSPTIICTFLLLGTLLTYGEPSIPEIEEEEEKMADEHSLLQMGSAANDLVVKDKRVSVVSHTENRGNVKGIPLKEANFTEQWDHVCKVESRMLLSASNEEEENLLMEWNKNPIHFDEKATGNREDNGRALFEKAESLDEYPVRDAWHVVHPVTSGEKETENLKVEMHEPVMERRFDCSLDSSQKLVYSHEAPDSASDHTERHPPNNSPTDITPIIDQLHPIIFSGAPQPVSTSVDESHSLSGSYVQGCNYDGNAEEKSEHSKEGTQKGKNHESAIPATCTADDEINHMDLSSSIRVRTKRLKSLIIKRRARKNLRAEAEKNSRGLNINKTAAMMNELSHIQLRIPPISRGRQNPFDLPFSSEDELDLPGSAPSTFLPRGNLFDEFDFLFDQEDENGGLTDVSLGHQGPVSLSQKDTFFRRYESFTVGASFTGEARQVKHDLKLMPNYGTESTILGESSYADFRGQLTDESFSKKASVPASESNSSVADREYNEPLEQKFHQDSHSKLIFPCDIKNDKKAGDFSNEVDFIESPDRGKKINICGIHAGDVSTFKSFEEETHETFDDFVEYENKVRYEMDLHSPTSDTANSDLAEFKYMESSSTHSSEVGDKNLSVKAEERSTDLQRSEGNHLKGSNYSVHSSNRNGQTSNDIHVVESARDSSPSVTGKSSLNTAAVDFNCISSTTTQSSDLCSPRPENNNTLVFGDLASGEGNRGGMHV